MVKTKASPKKSKETTPAKKPGDVRNAKALDAKAETATWENLTNRYTQSKTYFNKKRDGWEDNEKLFGGFRADSASDAGMITDGSLSTLIIERAARVMSQVQSGRVKEVGNTDSAAATVTDLIYQNDIIKNAKSGNPFLVKLRQTQIAKGLYGMCPVMYGLNVTDTNAFADFWLIKPQLYFPQPGKITPYDMQWCQVETTVTVGQLKSILAKDSTTWKKEAIEKLIQEASEGTTPDNVSKDRTSYGERTNYDATQIRGKGIYAPIVIRTEYQAGEKGHWITYAPEFDGVILRDTPNPHKNGKIPVVHNVSIPLFDEIYGLSDMDRGKPTQKTIDSFLNLGYANALLNVYPITKVKTGAVINSTLEHKPGATWRMDDLGAVQSHTTGSASADFFQTSISSLRSILLNQNGTTDTQLNARAANDTEFGKTPAAIQARGEKQNARDNWDVTMNDIFLSELASGLIDVKLNCATKPVQINLGLEQIKKLQSDKAIDKLIEVDGTTVTIKLAELKKGKYQYEVDAGTSVEADDATEHERLKETADIINNSPTLVQMATEEGYEISAGALLTRLIQSTGTNDAEEIIHKKTDEEMAAEQAEMAKMQAQQGQEQPPQGMPQDPNAMQAGEQQMSTPVDPAMQQMSQPTGNMPQEQPELHPFTQNLINDPNGFMQHLQGGGQ